VLTAQESDSQYYTLVCTGMKVKPCNGEPPLADPDTGREYDCGSGPNRQDCPSGSYCHQTPHFAQCCKKGKSPQVKLKVWN
jgi:coxsackievirus/adenovirus receptor